MPTLCHRVPCMRTKSGCGDITCPDWAVPTPPSRDPVKLSRERWELLYAAKKSEWQSGCTLRLLAPIELDGIVFLPAEYVPADYATYEPAFIRA